jgi:murein DD-endopeptidase MepM/ murein hydrolase activator NlpD
MQGAVTKPAPATTRPSIQTQNPEDTYVELPDESVNASPEEPVEDVDAPVKMTFVNPVEGYLLKGYDIDMPVYSLTMNDYRGHAGIDIIAYTGAPVVTIAEGTVQNVYTDPMMGNCISVKHPNGIVSYYMGLSDEVCDGIEIGAPVFCGQKLSSVGDSTLIEIGEESHMHFEVKVDNKYADPLKYVAYDVYKSEDGDNQSFEG